MPIVRRLLRILLWTAGALVALVLLLVATLLVGANTGPGRRLIETEAKSLTGGMIAIDGLGGRFPDRLRAATITVSDSAGPYVTIHDLVLDWHPLSLVHALINVDRLDAASIEVARLPVPAAAPKQTPPAKGGGLSLPFGLRLGGLAIARLAVDKPVIGTAAALDVTGHAAIASLAPILAGVALDNLPRGTLAVSLLDFSGRGHYALAGDVGPHAIGLTLDADEQAGGLVAALAHSDQISPLALHLALHGPTTAEVLALALHAGPLVATGQGTVDLVRRAAALDITANAPAMTPVAGVSWQSLAVDAHVHGPFAAPELAGRATLRGLAAGGATIGAIDATLGGDRGEATVHAVLSALRVPGPRPDLLADAPVTIDAHATLSDPTRPVTFRVTHPLLALDGTARTAGPLSAHVALRLPDLAPLAAAGGTVLDGHASLTAEIATTDGPKAGSPKAGSPKAGSPEPGPTMTATVDGRLAVTGGASPVAGLLGPDATFHLVASRTGATIHLDRLALDGRALAVTAAGTKTADALHATAHVALSALDALSPSLSGTLALDLAADGPMNDLAATVHAAGDVGAHGVPRGPITLDVSARHLPGGAVAPIEAHVALGGRLDGAPLSLVADATRAADGRTAVHLTALDWRSLHGRADLALAPHATVPTGTLAIGMTRLADLSRLAGQQLAGALTAKLDLQGPLARIDLHAAGLAAAGAHLRTLTLAGTVRDPQTAPDLDLRLAIAGAGTEAIDGVTATATARGRLDALASTLVADIPDFKGAPVHLTLADTLDLPKRTVTLDRLDAAWHGEAAHLAAATRIAYAPAVRIDHLRLVLSPPGGETPASIAIDGTVSPRLALVASVHDVTPSLAAPFAPTLHASGRIDADARLTGTTAAPDGTITVTAADLRVLSGPAASLAPAELRARATLAGGRARLDAALTAGPKIDLRVAGTAPIKGAGALALQARGRIDLAVANPILEQGGRHASGLVTLDASATGTIAHPSLAGRVTLANGDIQDYPQGLHLSAVAADIGLAGQDVVIRRFVAHAGVGTIEASGTAGVLAPGIPVDLRLLMHDASPVASDLLTAVLSADIRASGSVANGLRVAGRLTIDRADINIPNSLPASVATLHVIRPGDKPPALPGTAPATRPIALDLALAAPGQIFVRGHGLNAVLGGSLHVGGTSAAPQVSGAFEMRRGTFSLAGVNLTFTTGRVGFNGTTNGKLDPTIDFVAESVVNQYTADLEVSGYADKPKITLRSTPSLPQDQVLALILFGTETANLSPFQIAQIAAALASLTGGGGGFDPLSAARNALGLDTLSVGSGSGNGSNTGASVEGGKYVTRNVYVGARQATSGGGSQAVVQIDLTKRLKAVTTVGTGGTVTGATTPENDPGSSVGLKYQFRY